MRLSGMLILLAAVAMALAGMGLVMYSRKLTNETASKRIGLIRAGAATPGLRATNIDDTLVRSELHGGVEDVETRETERVLHRFRLATGRAVTVLLAVRLSAVAVLGLIGLIVASHFLSGGHHPQVPFLIAMALGISGWFIPGMVIAKRIKRRTKAIVGGFADALELLVICVEAGLSFEDGIDRISRILAQAQPALAEELATTAADLKILPSREAALTNLATRINMPSVRSVVTTLCQTLRYGTPLAQALRVVAGELRNDSLMKLEERANQLPTLMTIPMMLFIMPTIFMVVAGPAVLKVIDTFKH
jgi:tight adherence protein C